MEASMGQQCIPGHYCPEGTTTMEKCEQGTYNPNLGGRSIDDCE